MNPELKHVSFEPYLDIQVDGKPLLASTCSHMTVFIQYFHSGCINSLTLKVPRTCKASCSRIFHELK